MSSLLKSLIQDLINDRHEQAQVAVHEYLVKKVQEMTGMNEERHNPQSLDEEASRAEIGEKQKAFRAELQAALTSYMKKNGYSGFVVGARDEGYAISPKTPKINEFEEADALRMKIKKDIKPILDDVADGRKYQIMYNKNTSWDVIVRVPISSVS